MAKRDFYNSSGCADPTAYTAIGQIIRAEQQETDEKAHFLFKMIRFIIRESGFELLNRIELRDKRSGKEYR